MDPCRIKRCIFHSTQVNDGSGRQSSIISEHHPVDERLARQLQSVTVVEILVATPVGVNYLLDNVHQQMEKRLPLAVRRGVLRCSAVAEHPYGSNWCVFPQFFAPADISQSFQPFEPGSSNASALTKVPRTVTLLSNLMV